jgi:hypothetical protein
MPMRLSPVPFGAVLLGAALVLTACGGSTPAPTSTEGSPTSGSTPATTSTEGSPDSNVADVTPEEAAELAATNLPNLVVADDPTATEVLVVADGSVTTISRAATGDRPLLLWFWAPH